MATANCKMKMRMNEMSDDNRWDLRRRTSQAPGMLFSFFFFVTLLIIITRQLKFFLYLILDSNTHYHNHHEWPPQLNDKWHTTNCRMKMRTSETSDDNRWGLRCRSISSPRYVFFFLFFKSNSINDYLWVGYMYNNNDNNANTTACLHPPHLWVSATANNSSNYHSHMLK